MLFFYIGVTVQGVETNSVEKHDFCCIFRGAVWSGGKSIGSDPGAGLVYFLCTKYLWQHSTWSDGFTRVKSFS